MTFTVGNLSGLNLGAFAPTQVMLDADAAGRGWYLDGTPLDDAEFGTVFAATWMQTDPTGAPAGHYDLLTAIMHEMGHALGLGNSYLAGDRDELMYGWLYTRRAAAAGRRRRRRRGRGLDHERGIPGRADRHRRAAGGQDRSSSSGRRRSTRRPTSSWSTRQHRHGVGDQRGRLPGPEHQHRHHLARHARSRRTIWNTTAQRGTSQRHPHGTEPGVTRRLPVPNTGTTRYGSQTPRFPPHNPAAANPPPPPPETPPPPRPSTPPPPPLAPPPTPPGPPRPPDPQHVDNDDNGSRASGQPAFSHGDHACLQHRAHRRHRQRHQHHAGLRLITARRLTCL